LRWAATAMRLGNSESAMSLAYIHLKTKLG
jgi:hypothetical protein